MERALQHGARVTAEAQSRFRPRMLEKADYLSASTPLPLFSARLMTLLTAHDPRLSGYPSTPVASPRLVELCTSAHLNIGFTPVTMAG